MKEGIQGIVTKALEKLCKDGSIKCTRLPEVILERPKREEFGDFSTNIAMLLAPLEKRPPRELARIVAEEIGGFEEVERCEVAGPGFINIFIRRGYWIDILSMILEKGDGFGRPDLGRGEKVQVEFVSANPTGPLHIGHGRNAAVGDSVANILEAAGFDVTREYYVNDVGRQMYTLGRSLYLRYRELLGDKTDFPDDHYKGKYIIDMARDVVTKHGDKYLKMPEDEAVKIFKDLAAGTIMEGIKKDLGDFGVGFDVYYSEKSLFEKGLVTETIDKLRGLGVIYESEGATWFRTTDFGDDKDRVLIKADGSYTYFASDIAYHREKIDRGFSKIVDVWGADHHGYLARIKALFKALGKDPSMLRVIFIQLVSLLRGGEPVSMSTRGGEFITLREVMDEVGKDACRFFFLMRKADAHLDFDLELAKRQAPENPVYYVQYCHARISSIMGFAKEKGVTIPERPEPELLERLTLKEEIDLIRHLSMFEDVVRRSALSMEPHRITFYLMDLARLFHPYYNRNRVVTEDPRLTGARLLLCRAVKNVVGAGLGLLGVTAPEKM